MGVHNRMTAEKYKQLKAELESPADDNRVSEAYGVSKTTCRMVRNTSDFAEYCEKKFRYHGNPHKQVPTRPQEPAGRAERHIPVIVAAETESAVEREMRAASEAIRSLLFIMFAVLIAIVAFLIWRAA